ncbi:MAG: DeoR/GlpR family DNA-binding transcription regulator [Spirochaetes bacterium]|nr:DeoR/GlpR family DNA-binding transcription regulator [Spirochaetota bacterium]
MLAAERRAMILRLLRQDGIAPLADIRRLSGASEATARRDLAEMAAEGLIERVRGGAAALRIPHGAAARTPEVPLEERAGIAAEKKHRIARRAAGLCADGDTIMVDGGSTTLQLAPFLRGLRLRVITNSLALAEDLSRGSACTVILGGGVVQPESRLILDPFREDPFSDYSASTVFMGVFGIDESGATNTDELLIRAERAMIARARRLVVLADSLKFGMRGSLHLCGFDRISAVVTDDGIPEAWRTLLAERGVELVVA